MRLRDALLIALMSAPMAWAATPNIAATRGDPAKAKEIAENVCSACHGIDGNSVNPEYPILAGQHPEYLTKQLHDYKLGARKNAIMALYAANLSDADMLNLGAYFAAQTPKPGQAEDAVLATAGQRLYKGGNPASGVPACASCHGPNGAGIPVQFPRLAGQHASYIETQLRNYRSGERAYDAGSKMMQAIASKMTDQEMRAVAEYISSLR